MSERLLSDRIFLAKTDLRYKKREVVYNTRVSKEKRVEASENAQLFAGELLSFIRENPTGMFAPLHLTSEQYQLITYCLDTAENESLQLRTNQGQKVDDTIFHYVSYEANDWQHDGTTAEQIHSLFKGHDISFSTRWDHDVQKAKKGWLSGRQGRTNLRLSFLATEKQLEETDSLHTIIGYDAETKNSTTDIHVFQNGERLVINHEIEDKHENHSMTEQFYLLGAFDGEETKQTYFLYGSNHDRHFAMSSRSKVTESTPARVTVGV